MSRLTALANLPGPRYHALAEEGSVRKMTSLWHKGESVVQNTSFVQTQTIIHALEFAISKGGFGRNPQQKRTAAALVKNMKSNKSVSGRHQQLVALLKKGVTLEGMMKATRASVQWVELG